MITTFSQFFYGHTVSNGAGGGLGNYTIDFNEGASDLIATLNPGDYTLTEFVQEVKRALDAAGTLTYTVSVNRTTRKITVSSTAPFDLLTNSGATFGTAVWALLGFTTGADHTGASTYTAENASGELFRPQAILQDYIGRDVNLEKLDAVVNQSATGVVQTVQFGDVRYFKFNMLPITDMSVGSCSEFEQNTNAIAEAAAFFEFAITKSRMEFMPDRDTPATFYKVLLESTKAARDGTAYELQPVTQGVYESGDLKFRELTS